MEGGVGLTIDSSAAGRGVQGREGLGREAVQFCFLGGTRKRDLGRGCVQEFQFQNPVVKHTKR